MQVIRQQAVIAARTADVQAWEDTVSKQASQHVEIVKKLQVRHASSLRFRLIAFTSLLWMVLFMFCDDQADLDEKQSELSAVKKELTLRPSLAEVSAMKQQLSALQALYFNAQDDDFSEGGGVEGTFLLDCLCSSFGDLPLTCFRLTVAWQPQMMRSKEACTPL